MYNLLKTLYVGRMLSLESLPLDIGFVGRSSCRGYTHKIIGLAWFLPESERAQILSTCTEIRANLYKGTAQGQYFHTWTGVDETGADMGSRINRERGFCVVINDVFEGRHLPQIKSIDQILETIQT